MASYLYQSIEDQINEALDSIHNGLYINYSATARAYNVSKQTLQRRWNRGASKSTRPRVNEAFTGAQQQIVRKYIAWLDTVNMSARPRIVVGAANYLLKFEDCKVSHQCGKSRFVKRNSNFLRKQKPLTADRKNSHNVADMKFICKNLRQLWKRKE